MAYWHEDFPSLPALYVIETLVCVGGEWGGGTCFDAADVLFDAERPAFSCDSLVSGEIFFPNCWWSGGRLVVVSRRRE